MFKAQNVDPMEMADDVQDGSVYGKGFAQSGGVSGAGEFLLNAVRAKLPELVFYKSMKYARIELARLGNDAGIIGAAMLGR